MPEIASHQFQHDSRRDLASYAFVYRCPRTGQQVQGHVTDALIEDDGTYEPVTCIACGRTHLVNPKTGRLLEQAKK